MTNLPTKRVKAIPQANNFHCFTYNMAAKTAGIDKKRNYVTDTLCIPMRVSRITLEVQFSAVGPL